MVFPGRADKSSHKVRSIAVMGIKGLPSKGGGERVAEAIIKKALDENFQVYVYGKKSYCENFIGSNNLKLILIRDFKGKHLSAFSFGLFSAFHALLFGNYDLIHLHYADFGYIVPFLRIRYKIIGTSHGAEYNRDKWGKFAKFCFRLFEIPFVKFTNICTSVSKPLAEYYRNKYKKNILYIPNGINFNDTQKIGKEACRKYKLPINEYILFCAGRIIPSKGCDLLLKANKKLSLKIPLVIIGSTEDNFSYKNYLEKLATSNVVFIDFIKSKQELLEIISNCKFFIFPSTYEAMSMMLLEVASLKKGIVCSDIPENFEAVGKNAIFFKSGDVNSLAIKIQFALYNENEIDKIGKKALNWIVRNRNWKQITQSYINIYKSF